MKFEENPKTNQNDIECNLEFFNSRLDEGCTIKDSLGKEVYLVLENLKLKELRYK